MAIRDESLVIDRLFRERREAFLHVLTGRVGNREEAEEVFQEAFIRFERARASRAIDNPDAYLMRTALNLAVDRLRQNAVRSQRERRWFEAGAVERRGGDYEEPLADPERALIAKDELARIGRHLEKLSPTVRTAFILHKIRGLSHDETAKKMNLSKSTVEKHIIKAMGWLLDRMAE